MLAIDWWSLAIGVIGVVATIVFGIVKKRGYPGRLTYFYEPAIRLLDDVTGNLPQIAVRYKDEPVRKNLTLLRAFLVNTGSKDITKEMVEKPLTIELADGYRRLEASAKSPLDGEDRAKITDPKTVVLSLGLFRCNEFLRYEALIEVSEGKTPAGKLGIFHRIADTGAVDYESVPEKPKSPWKEYGFFLVLMMYFGSTFLFNFHDPPWTGTVRTVGIVVGIVVFSFCFLVTCLVVSLLRYNRKIRRIRRILNLDSD